MKRKLYYVIKFVRDLVGGFTPDSSTNKTGRYNWNIVESDIKHHNPTPMKRKFKHGCINKANNYLSLQFIDLKQRKWHMQMEIKVLAWDR